MVDREEISLSSPDTGEDTTNHATLQAKFVEVFSADRRVSLVIALGSTADGEHTEFSDIDVCVVTRDDRGLNEILRELNSLFAMLGPLVGYFAYNPYHFYAIYNPALPLDVYFISASLYYCLRGDRRSVLVDRAPKDVGSLGAESKDAIVSELLLRAWIRTARLLSKLAKADFVTLLYILNQIREEEIVPLLALVRGYRFSHIKAVNLDTMDEGTRSLFVATYGSPNRDGCLNAIRAAATLIQVLHTEASKGHDADRLDRLARDVSHRITSFE